MFSQRVWFQFWKKNILDGFNFWDGWLLISFLFYCEEHITFRLSIIYIYRCQFERNNLELFEEFNSRKNKLLHLIYISIDAILKGITLNSLKSLIWAKINYCTWFSYFYYLLISITPYDCHPTHLSSESDSGPEIFLVLGLLSLTSASELPQVPLDGNAPLSNAHVWCTPTPMCLYQAASSSWAGTEGLCSAGPPSEVWCGCFTAAGDAWAVSAGVGGHGGNLQSSIGMFPYNHKKTPPNCRCPI
jgi:hypothetical protein